MPCYLTGIGLTSLRQGSQVNITATGYTDRSGSEDYNLKLSLQHADAVRDYLTKGGIPADQITVAGRGPTLRCRPRTVCASVEIVLQ